MRRHTWGGVIAGFLWLAGCAHSPPPELVSARNAYSRASAGPAARVVPAELHKARVALEAANSAFDDTPDSMHARDLAYVAERKAQLAEALAVVQLDAETKAKADAEFQKQQASMAQRTRQELVQTREQLASAERARTQATQDMAQEQKARAEAEQKAADANQKASEATQKATQAEQQAHDALSKLAAVKEESRGMVITLSGSVLFASNKWTLLPEAQTRLNQVADALLATKERNIVIEGYTDSRGADETNLELSRLRAVAVRDYLISRGYPMEHIQAVGLGESRPIADNLTAEGRANNRRVEIIVQPRTSSYSQR
jgi:outer membrane protein OmpA-like peptidoglycan-associated protein